jgi:hypothetical protein
MSTAAKPLTAGLRCVSIKCFATGYNIDIFQTLPGNPHRVVDAQAAGVKLPGKEMQ